MLRWCAYCQRFMGESPPFTDYAMTHGVCEGCCALGKDERKGKVDSIDEIRKFYTSLRVSARQGHALDLAAILDKAFNQLKIRPYDLFIGLVQPLLYEIGQLWAEGKTTIANEHKFTAFAEAVLAELDHHALRPAQSNNQAGQADEAHDILLTCVEGNTHSLGVRSLNLALRQEGIRSLAIYPSLPPHEILILIKACKASSLGVSIALESQKDQVENLARVILNSVTDPHFTIILGGAIVKEKPQMWQLGPRLCLAPTNIHELVALLQASRLQSKARREF